MKVPLCEVLNPSLYCMKPVRWPYIEVKVPAFVLWIIHGELVKRGIKLPNARKLKNED